MSIPSGDMGPFFRSQRLKFEFTQNCVAKKCKISPQFLGHIEKGSVPIPIPVLASLVKLFKTPEKTLERMYMKSQRQIFKSLVSQLKRGHRR